MVPAEDVAETVTPLTKTTTIGSQTVAQAVETSTKGGESIASSTSTTIITETNPSTRTDEISHREHGRALNLTMVASAIPAKAKGLNDLSDVSMDDDSFGDNNGAKEEMVIAQTQHKECESKVRKIDFPDATKHVWHTIQYTLYNVRIHRGGKIQFMLFNVLHTIPSTNMTRYEIKHNLNYTTRSSRNFFTIQLENLHFPFAKIFFERTLSPHLCQENKKSLDREKK